MPRGVRRGCLIYFVWSGAENILTTVCQIRAFALSTIATATLLAVMPYTSLACSAAACINSGPEFRPDFAVVLKHEGKPLRGATVEITSNTEGNVARRFYGVTASDGIVRVNGLSPGEYWLDARLMGIAAAYHCFHIAQRTSRNAKRRLTYEWGDVALATREVAGKLIDSQPGTGGTPLWNLLHRVNAPITGARLTLLDPFTGAVFNANSDVDGAFSFADVPDGLYVLHAEGGKSNREFETADHLVRVTSKAKGNTLVLTKRDAGGGDCGGTSLDLGTR
jgi:hypothetical protein